MDLFLHPKVAFEKVSAAVDLPEDPNAWSKEILDELYKQVPYIADFNPHVVMSKVDAERAYGLGHVEVENQSQLQAQTSDPQMQGITGVRSVRIPIVIKDGKLSPFDLFLNDAGKLLPLTEARLRQALFRPQMFDVASETPGDQSTIGQLYPPYRNAYGFGSGVTQMAKMSSVFEEYLIKELEKADPGFRRPEMQKSASKFEMKKTASILNEIKTTIHAGDQDAFCEKLASDQDLQLQYRRNQLATAPAVHAIMSTEPYTAEKTAEALHGLVRPTVVQLVKTAEGYAVRSANHDFWDPKVESIHRGDLIRRFGEKIALAVDKAGGVTMADGADTVGQPEQAKVEPATHPGTYKVYDADGKELVGTVIPNLIDIDGEPTPLALFTNGSQATVQSEIFGSLASEELALPSGPIQGSGAFYYQGPEGVCALLPMNLQGSSEMPGEPGSFHGEVYDGRPIEVSVQPNIDVPTPAEEGKLIIPETWKWMSLENAMKVSLAGGPEVPDSEEKVGHYVSIRSCGTNEFSLSGPAVEKLASSEREFVRLEDAMFILAGLGVEQGFGLRKLAQATISSSPELVLAGRHITPASELQQNALAAAEEKIAGLPDLKRDLVKEAAVIPDPMAVDTVLSLGFINEENISMFISYLPSIDDAQMKLCELLLGVRLGLSEVPESALERSIRATEEVIEGLKVMAFQGN